MSQWIRNIVQLELKNKAKKTRGNEFLWHYRILIFLTGLSSVYAEDTSSLIFPYLSSKQPPILASILSVLNRIRNCRRMSLFILPFSGYCSEKIYFDKKFHWLGISSVWFSMAMMIWLSACIIKQQICSIYCRCVWMMKKGARFTNWCFRRIEVGKLTQGVR